MFLKTIHVDPGDFPCRDRYPFNVRSLSQRATLELCSGITMFTGQNGAGKSTFLDSLAMKTGLLPWGGTKTHSSHSNPYEAQLSKYISVEWVRRKPYGFYFRAEAFFNFACSLDDILNADPARSAFFGGSSLNMRSHGESFLNFFKGYSFSLDGLYLIDEPEAALDPQNQVEFVKTLVSNSKKGDKQYIISTLSPLVLACPGAQIFNFDDAGISSISWRESYSYRFYQEFLSDPQAFLTKDLDDQDVRSPNN